MNDTFTNEGVTLHNVKESDFDFLKPNPECAMCDVVEDYVCFFCEVDQVQDQTTAILTDCCTWVETTEEITA
jgi:hypothetical protein